MMLFAASLKRKAARAPVGFTPHNLDVDEAMLIPGLGDHRLPVTGFHFADNLSSNFADPITIKAANLTQKVEHANCSMIHIT
ncbi:MAG: hypothetical protein WCQ90_04660 [Deltaproteobacteria bacterium]